MYTGKGRKVYKCKQKVKQQINIAKQHKKSENKLVDKSSYYNVKKPYKP